jgi:hypothetical protein
MLHVSVMPKLLLKMVCAPIQKIAFTVARTPSPVNVRTNALDNDVDDDD